VIVHISVLDGISFSQVEIIIANIYITFGYSDFGKYFYTCFHFIFTTALADQEVNVIFILNEKIEVPVEHFAQSDATNKH
jgi:hypothetical protein